MSKLLTLMAIGAALLSSLCARADQTPMPRIGALLSIGNSPLLSEGLRDGLRELGYNEGQNVVIEWRSAASDVELRANAIELALSKLDVIVVNTTAGARAALEASTTVPIVFGSGDPVATGLAATLARPGGNATGVSVLSTELYPKRLEYLHWLAPRARRIAFLMNSSNPIAVTQLEATQRAAPMLGVQLVKLDARNESELRTVLHALQRGAADGAIVTNDVVYRSAASQVAQVLRQARLPAIFPYRQYLEEGGLMSYGPDPKEVGRKLAVYVDKILKGAKPADLPIEQLSKYELVIDLRVARELKLNVPQDLLLRADEVIQ
jgi:putative ABC transport system substrate-binding protein